MLTDSTHQIWHVWILNFKQLHSASFSIKSGEESRFEIRISHLMSVHGSFRPADMVPSVWGTLDVRWSQVGLVRFPPSPPVIGFGWAGEKTKIKLKCSLMSVSCHEIHLNLTWKFDWHVSIMSIDESSVAFIAFFVEGLKPNDAIIGFVLNNGSMHQVSQVQWFQLGIRSIRVIVRRIFQTECAHTFVGETYT